MIYLIDNKKLRQEINYGWTSEKLAFFGQHIYPIYTLDELESRTEEIFRDDNTVLYHESFLDDTMLNKHSAFKRSKLEQFAQNHKTFKLVIFSGSKNSRILNDNIAHLPVSIVYQNLKRYLEKYAENCKDLDYLVFGDNPKIESELLERLDVSLAKMEQKPAIIDNQSCLFIPTFDKYIRNPIENAIIVEFYDQENDSDISEFIENNLSQTKYDNIFIPLCYGSTLSDYNGLRLATHIRCTPSLNQLSRIFIYGFVGLDYLLCNEYFNILKTKCIHLISFSKQAFKESADVQQEPFRIEELSDQIATLKLDIPTNYEDTHSIANEWGIYRWAKAIKAKDSEIEKIVSKVNNQLYFKYLKSIYSEFNNSPISENDLKIKYSGNPKILFIDDEADKGWYEIFCRILYDINGLSFEYLDEEFNFKTQDEIIKASVNKIVKDNIDIVILDFRLHPIDFNTNKIEEVTGFKILQEIKIQNPGIQVIIFSATNKVWNLQAMLEKGADGFIVKESPDSNIDKSFTRQAIYSFLSCIQTATKRKFLKQVFEKCRSIETQISQYDYEDGSEYEKFLLDLRKQINLIVSASKHIDLKESMTLDIVFLNCYNFLEKYKHYYLREIDRQFVLGIDEVEMNRYNCFDEIINNEGPFLRINQNDNPSWFNVLSGIFIDYFSILKIDSKEIKDLYRIKDKRNQYIHNNKKKFDQNELLMILSLCEKISSCMKE